MGALLFLLSFLATGIAGAETLAGFETTRSDQIGAEAFLFSLCFGTALFSVLSYLLGVFRFHRSPGKIAGLVGGVVAALTFCGSAATVYLGFYFAFSVTLALMLPSSIAFVWPLLAPRYETLELPLTRQSTSD